MSFPLIVVYLYSLDRVWSFAPSTPSLLYSCVRLPLSWARSQGVFCFENSSWHVCSPLKTAGLEAWRHRAPSHGGSRFIYLHISPCDVFSVPRPAVVLLAVVLDQIFAHYYSMYVICHCTVVYLYSLDRVWSFAPSMPSLLYSCEHCLHVFSPDKTACLEAWRHRASSPRARRKYIV
jgi:hypothetical protein